jgi:hypothetical protein
MALSSDRLLYTTAQNLKAHIEQLEIEYAKHRLPPPTLQEKLARKTSSRAKQKLGDDNLNILFEECTLNKKQRYKQQHVIAAKLGFNTCRCTIKIHLRKSGLNRCKSTKKLSLTDIQKA